MTSITHISPPRARSRRALAGAVLGLALAAPAAAQSPRPLTIDEAVRLGLEQSPRLAEIRARESAASHAIAARQALRRPVLTALGGYLRTNHVEEFAVPQPGGALRVIFPDIPSNYRARAEISAPLYTSGRIDWLVESAQADRRAVAADVRAAEQDLRLDITRAYWSLVTARETVRVIDVALSRADAVVADVKSRVDAGVLPPNDLLSAQAQRARQSVRLIEARQAAGVAEMDLARLTGLPVGGSIVPASPVDQPPAGADEVVTQPIDALLARARAARPEREGLAERQAASRATAAATVAGLRPQVHALAAVEPARPNPRFVPRADQWNTAWDLGVTVSVPLWDGGRARAEQAVALAQADAAGHRLREFDAGVEVEVRQRRLEIDSTRAAIAASSEAVVAATEARRVVEERFAAGVATSTDVLDGQLALLEAELELTRLSAALRLVEARLLRAVGAS
jgi:OMF family outer membrane factor